MSLQTHVKPLAKAVIIEESGSYDLIIIGGGPAGLTAAIYALRSKLRILLVEKMILGGMASTTSRIDNYPGFPDGVSGMDLTQKMAEQATKLGLEIIYGSVSRIRSAGKEREVQVDGKLYAAKAIIIASGTEPSKLGIPGEEMFLGRGVSYCATCDGPFYQNKNVIVIGGGNSAVEEALYLTRFASKVSIVHRRDQLRADRILAEHAKHHPKIYFYWHSSVEEILGDKMVKEVMVKDLSSDKKIKVPAEGVFIYVGSKPNSGMVKELVKMDSNGFIVTDEQLKTSQDGLYAAGDVRVKSLRQIVTAAADGAIAAESARIYIES